MPRVLIIEDHPSARRGWVEYLRTCGCDVLEAPDGETGLALARAHQVDVIVLDLGLPDIDGWSVARQLKVHPNTAAVALIALTGSDLADDRERAFAAGCDRHLSKPCAPAALLAAIHEARLPTRAPADGAGL